MWLWKLLSSRYGELDAARVVAKLVGAIVDHGEQQISKILNQSLTAPPPLATGDNPSPAQCRSPCYPA